MTTAIVEENFWIPAGGRKLEGVLAYPEFEPPRRGVLLLPPHPHMGGRMDNNVIEHLARRLAEDGCAALRFNYGGVGKSELEIPEGQSPYEYWEAIETSKTYGVVLPDAIAARAYLVGALPSELPVTYVGYSFGCCLAALLAQVHPPESLAAISPPLREAPLVGLEDLDVPTCFVAGDNDFVFDRKRLEASLAAMPGRTEFVELDGCDHFFRRQEERVYQVLRPTVVAVAASRGEVA